METMKRKNKEEGVRGGRKKEDGREKSAPSRRMEMIVCREWWDNKLLPFFSNRSF